ncbi:hypothetical protein D9M70_462910 [compost metagenome]
MPLVHQGEHGAEIAVVHRGIAFVGAAEIADVGFQGQPFGQRQAVQEVGVMLPVVVLQLGLVVGGRQAGGGRPGDAGIVEAVAGDAADRAVGEHGHVLVVAGVAQAGGAELASGEGQLVEVVGDDLRALEGLRQQPGVIAEGHGQRGRVGAHREHGLAQPRLGGRAEEPEFIGHLAVALHLQGTGAAGAAPGVELDPQEAQAVDAESQGTVGEAGGIAQHEALRPLLGFGLGLTVKARGVRLVGVPVVAVHVEVAGFQAQLAVGEKVGAGRQRQQA